jgi:hypothetical protein
MTSECIRLLAGPTATASREIAFDLYHRRFLVTELRRAPRCRFDHKVVTEHLRLGKDWTTATVGDLLATTERRFGPVPAHFELPRGWVGDAGFGPRPFVSPDDLRPRSGTTLASFGLVPGDRVRVRTASQSAFLMVE